jgi:membrane protease YdiL (CAAX protease family)
MHDAPDSPDSDNLPPPTGAEEGASVPAPTAPAPVGRAVWWEVAAVLAVGVIPNMSSAVSHLCDPAPPSPYWLDSLNLSVLSACTILVTLYLMSRSGESWERFGLAPPRILDAPLGGLMLVAATLVWFLLPRIPDLGVRTGTMFTRPQGAGDFAWMAVKYSLSAFAEELVTRAYLITRLTMLLRSRGEAVLVAALLFASYHAYQGPVGAVYSFAFGLTYGAAFLLFGRVWPLAIGHTLYNVCVELMAR